MDGVDRSSSRGHQSRKEGRRSESPDRHLGSSRRHRDERDRSHRKYHDRERYEHEHEHEHEHERPSRDRRNKEDGRRAVPHGLDDWAEKKQKQQQKHKRSTRQRRDTPSDDDDLLDIRRMGIRPISEDDYLYVPLYPPPRPFPSCTNTNTNPSLCPSPHSSYDPNSTRQDGK